MLLASVLLLASSIMLSWLLAVRKLNPLDRPSAASGGPWLVILAVWSVIFVAGVALAWMKSGWPWGIGGLVVGFWVLPRVLEGFWLRLYTHP